MDHNPNPKVKVKPKYRLKTDQPPSNNPQLQNNQEQLQQPTLPIEKQINSNQTLKNKTEGLSKIINDQTNIKLPISNNASKIPDATKFNHQGESKKKYVGKDSEETILSVKNILNESDCRRLKKFMVEIDPLAEKIDLFYHIDKPVVRIEYWNGKEKKICNVRELLNGNEKLRKNKDLILNIYDTLYRKVSVDYFDIGFYALKKAKEKRIRFRDRNFKDKATKDLIDEYPFYYACKDQYPKFVIFDSALNCVEFEKKDISKQNYEKEYEIFLEFERKELKESIEGQNDPDYFGQEEVDSDEETRTERVSKQKGSSLRELRDQLDKYLKMDLSEIDKEIEDKNEQVLRLVKENVRGEVVEKLADEVMEKSSSLENFNKTLQSVQESLSKDFASKEEEDLILKSCLKRMILASKQLNSELPIISRKREIFEKLDKSNLLILEGETGSGKSTQLPQMLCEYYKIFENPSSLPVLITQPRKLATRSLAERVANEMSEEIHGFVDYQTSATGKVNSNAKIVFKMDRLVLDELKEDSVLSKYCCLVIDEAHERTISIDVILGLIQKLLKNRKDFKIIVTSASMDTDLFKTYFKTELLKVSGRMFPVEEVFEPFEFEKDTVGKIKRVINDRLLDVGERNLKKEFQGHVLAFCSGLDQIAELQKYYQEKLNPRVFKVFSLHGKLSPEEQKEVFQKCKEYKIIFTSRIAETSITIDGVKVVIDPGMDREMIYDQKNKITSMKLQNISQSSAKQRAGRAGRTNTGYCFRLYSKKDKNSFSVNKLPEIQNMALDTVVLRLKSLNIEDIINFPYLSKPKEEDLKNSIEIMKMLNCLEEKTERITPIGEFLVKLPLEPFLARAIFEAMLMEEVLKTKKNFIVESLSMSSEEKAKLSDINLIEETIRILCMIISSSNLFFVRTEEREMADKNKFEKLSDHDGDFFFLLNIYKKYIDFYRRRENNEMKNWARQHYLSLKTLSQVRELEREINLIIKQSPVMSDKLAMQILPAEVKLKQSKTVREAILSCLVSSFATTLGLYSNNEEIGYTVVSMGKPMSIYGSSILSLQGITPKWILFYDLYENEKGKMFCKIANAVDFEFLKKNTNDYILDKYKVREAEKNNPFYDKITKEVSSLLFSDILCAYQKRNYDNESHLEFLKKFYINFYEERNTIDIFFNKKEFEVSTLSKISSFFKINSSFRESRDPVDIFEGFIKEIKARYTKSLNYNYVGPIYIDLSHGFKLDRIKLENEEHIYTFIHNGNANAFEFLQWIHSYCSSLGEIETYRDKLIFRVQDEQNRKYFDEISEQLIKGYYEKYKIMILKKHSIEDRRKKIPQAKLFMHFWAGKSEKDNLLFRFNREENINLEEMLNCLEKGQMESKKAGMHDLSEYRFALTKKKDSINCFPPRTFPPRTLHPRMFGLQMRPEVRSSSLDEFEMNEIILEFHKRVFFGYGFRIPRIIKFTEPEIQQAIKTESEWENEIRCLFTKNGLSEEKIAIRVWGNNYRPRENYRDTDELTKKMKIEWNAEIKSFDLTMLQKIKNLYDKRTGVLGCEKVHAKFEFEQVVAIITKRVFTSLIEEYEFIVDYTKEESPLVTITYFERLIKNNPKVYIKIFGQNRDELIKPSLKIVALFTPKIVPLTPPKFRFLDKMDMGNDILEEIENYYQYKVYFAFDRKNCAIKLYCPDNLFKEVNDLLKTRLDDFHFYEEEISFKGKNLHIVKEILEKEMEEIYNSPKRGNKVLYYEILFKYRKVRATADFETLEKVKNEINKIINKSKPECEICSDLIQRPYKLYVCSHEFCLSCLSSHIRESINNVSANLLKCPSCEEAISVFDVRSIMTEEEFNKLCDIKISRFIENSPEYHACLSPNCENIFETEETKKNSCFECDLCGKWFCWKCKEPHKGYNCEDWKFKLDAPALSKLGIKKCPKCGQGIQKNQGCNHISCRCGAHICWKCMKDFKNAKECYDHLAHQCGGIFDPGAQ